nr:MAG TPA: hypothetical protein [Caudoviricetes sp.]
MTSAQIDNKNLLNQIIKYISVISSWAPNPHLLTYPNLSQNCFKQPF